MASITEMVVQILSAHASSTPMTTDELLSNLKKIHATLQALETGAAVSQPEEEQKPTLTGKQSIKKNEVICLVCNKGGFKTLTRHLNQAHNMKPGAYRKQFNIPTSQKLSIKSFSEARQKNAQERGLADHLVKAREVKAANIAKKKAESKETAKIRASKRVSGKPIMN